MIFQMKICIVKADVEWESPNIQMGNLKFFGVHPHDSIYASKTYFCMCLTICVAEEKESAGVLDKNLWSSHH